MAEIKIKFEDHVYYEAMVKLGFKYANSFANMYKKHGKHRFEAAFIDTYVKVRLQDDGDLDEEIIQTKFITKLRERLKDYSNPKVLSALSSVAIHAADTFGGKYTDNINELLQCILVTFVRNCFGIRKIVNHFEKMVDFIDKAESYDLWCAKIKLLAA